MGAATAQNPTDAGAKASASTTVATQGAQVTLSQRGEQRQGDPVAEEEAMDDRDDE